MLGANVSVAVPAQLRGMLLRSATGLDLVKQDALQHSCDSAAIRRHERELGAIRALVAQLEEESDSLCSSAPLIREIAHDALGYAIQQALDVFEGPDLAGMREHLAQANGLLGVIEMLDLSRGAKQSVGRTSDDQGRGVGP